MKNKIKTVILWTAAALVVIASLFCTCEFIQNSFTGNFEDIGKYRDDVAKLTIIYCVVALVFLFWN
ncbi:hypothetical protein [Erwinia billingiae]|uniref:hypothetical protein n=1 Tax=Erwinia billingiae TaxID=182337 RepID=UPI0019D01710|nr:hypothetical protein [Erwinia billingiae]